MGRAAGRGGLDGSSICAIIVLVIVVITISATLFGVSFAKLDANEVGLDYSANSLTLDLTQLYSPGVQFLGLGHSFIKFPTTIQELAMTGSDAVLARTYDGLQVTIQAKILYELTKEVNALASLYLMFPDDYVTPYTHIARAVIRDVASEYTAFEFWTYRDNITTQMQTDLGLKFADVFAYVSNFLLTDFDLPDLFQTALQATEVALQEQAKVQFEISTTITDTQTAVLASSKTAEIIALQANATATALVLDYDAEVVRVTANIGAEVVSYAALQTALGLNEQELIAYVWLNTLSTTTSVPRYISLKSMQTMQI